jgi:ribosomal 30S subunit maturation factor RimM
MYKIELIGAIVFDQDGDSIGLVTSIEDRAEGPCINITNGEEPRAKSEVPNEDINSKIQNLRDAKIGV